MLGELEQIELLQTYTCIAVKYLDTKTKTKILHTKKCADSKVQCVENLRKLSILGRLSDMHFKFRQLSGGLP